jgi:hypothetical protein
MADNPGADARWAYAAYYLAPFGRFRESAEQLKHVLSRIR